MNTKDNSLEARIERQLKLDEDVSLRGQTKHEQNNKRVDPSDTTYGRALGYKAVSGFNQELNRYIEEKTAGRSSRSILIRKLIADQNAEELELLVNPNVLAKIIVKTVINSAILRNDKRLTATAVAFQIGKMTEFALNEQLIDLKEPMRKRGMLDYLSKQDRIGDEVQVMEGINYLAENLQDVTPWEEADHLKVGEMLLRLFLNSEVTKDSEDGILFSHLFKEEYVTPRGPIKKTNRYFVITDLGQEWMDLHDELVKSMKVSFLPMVVKPRRWDETLSGGYHDETIRQRYTLVKGRSNKTISKLLFEYKEGFNCLFKTINNLQGTSFTVNSTVFDALNWVVDGRVELNAKGCPTWKSAWKVILGEARAEEFFTVREGIITGKGWTADQYWEVLMPWLRTFIEGEDNDVKKAWGEYKIKVKKMAIASRSKALQAKTIRDDAEIFLNEPEIYFPYNCDSRYRIYPISGMFNPQGSDCAKGLLQFSEGCVVESVEAIESIAHQIAGTFGIDKCTLDERVDWVLDNEDAIIASAEDFVTGDFWRSADAPFSALLACLTWKAFRDEGIGFTSYLPIAFDGSTNALQHYAAVFLDEEMAPKVNLTDQEVPSDIYQDVADVALSSISSVKGKNARRLTRLNDECDGKIFGRKTVKKSVMTLGYSISQRSSSKYCKAAVLELGLALDHSDISFINKNIGKLTWKAMEETLYTPFQGRDFLQDISIELVEAGLPVRWETPTGLPCEQNYRQLDPKPNKVKITVDGHEYYRKYPKYTNSLDPMKNSLALAPNIIHSHDGGHLQLSINNAADEGISNFLVIHDSFATDANSATRFNEIIRESFVQLYQGDHFGRYHQDAKERLEEVGIIIDTQPIVRGNFDLDEVLKATFFFR